MQLSSKVRVESPAEVAVQVIVAGGLTKRYGDVTAVRDVSLRIPPGEIYGLLGLNGAGKTTMIRMLLGMVRPSAGGVELFGTRVRPGRLPIWGRVGYLVETPAAYPELTVRENLEIVYRLRRLARPAAVPEVIERLALGPYPDRNVTIFWSSHILAEVSRLATRIGIIHNGRLIEELDAAELARRERPRLVVTARDPAGARVALRAAGFDPGGAAATGPGAAGGDGWGGPDGALVLTEEAALRRPDDVATVLVAAGYPPTSLTVTHDDLESHFLRLVGAGTGGDDG